MKKIYIINGAAGVGKDTFVEIAKYLIFINIGGTTYNISSVDAVKKAAEILGWDCQKDEKGRKFLSDLKDLSTENYNGPYHYMCKQIDNKQNGFFFLHIREPEEIFYFKKNHPETKTILIKRDKVEKFTNHADKNVDNYNYDAVISNSGTIEDLIKEVERFLIEELKNVPTL